MHFHREKANLAVTVCNDKEEIMAHSIFLDYPNWNVAKQDNWIPLFRELDKEIPCTVRKHKARWLEQSDCGREDLVSDKCQSVSGLRTPTDAESIITVKKQVVESWNPGGQSVQGGYMVASSASCHHGLPRAFTVIRATSKEFVCQIYTSH